MPSAVYGLGGLESQYEKTLRGRAGEARVERDPQGNDIPGGESIVKSAQRGKDIVLTTKVGNRRSWPGSNRASDGRPESIVRFCEKGADGLIGRALLDRK